MASDSKLKKQPNTLPDWWTLIFCLMQLGGLLPLTYQHLTDPLGSFLEVLPPGYDRATDGITSSLRIEMRMQNDAQCYPMIILLFVGGVLFARNSLRGQPKLQQRLVNLIVFTGFVSDLWIYAVLALKLPPQVLWTPSRWTPPIKGIAYGLPGATLLKLCWIFGIGRDVV